MASTERFFQVLFLPIIWAENMGSKPEPFGSIIEPCNSCNAECCRNYVVCLTSFDFVRLADFLGSKDFCYAVQSREVSARLVQSFFLWENDRFGEYYLCIRRDKREFCSLYGSGKVCTVHPARPRVCKIYPFSEGEKRTIVHKEAYRWPTNWNLSKEFVASVLGDIDAHQKELFEYGKICREWNSRHARKGSFSGFLEFIYQKTKLLI